jgi:putative pyruvate formate lyase activating enzyme
MEDEEGFCQTGSLARVSGFDLHFGEEEPLVGTGGSGTIFFMQCNLACEFCQNWEVSHGHACGQRGTSVTVPDLARIMLDLQERGAENINLVTPSHVVPQILEALVMAADQGLTLPLVYNTGSYDSPETLALLDKVVDIYLPDVKFWDKEAAKTYIHAGDYPKIARKAVRIMYEQVGDLVTDERSMAQRGVLVRHLVMPGGIAGTRQWMRFLADLSPDMYVNVMGQYHPCGRASQFPALARSVTPEEVEQAKQAARDAGLTRLDDRESRLLEALMQRMSQD